MPKYSTKTQRRDTLDIYSDMNASQPIPLEDNSDILYSNGLLEAPTLTSDNICPIGFPTYQQYKNLEAAYLASLSKVKRNKALITQQMFDSIWDVLLDPNARVMDAQFRFWVRKMFTLSTVNIAVHGETQTVYRAGDPVVLHNNRPVAVKEQLYELLCYCHALSRHGGRDKTCAAVRQLYSWIPKELIARFVMACPTCVLKKNGGCPMPPPQDDIPAYVEPRNDSQTYDTATATHPARLEPSVSDPSLRSSLSISELMHDGAYAETEVADATAVGIPPWPPSNGPLSNGPLQVQQCPSSLNPSVNTSDLRCANDFNNMFGAEDSRTTLQSTHGDSQVDGYRLPEWCSSTEQTSSLPGNRGPQASTEDGMDPNSFRRDVSLPPLTRALSSGMRNDEDSSAFLSPALVPGFQGSLPPSLHSLCIGPPSTTSTAYPPQIDPALLAEDDGMLKLLEACRVRSQDYIFDKGHRVVADRQAGNMSGGNAFSPLVAFDVNTSVPPPDPPMWTPAPTTPRQSMTAPSSEELRSHKQIFFSPHKENRPASLSSGKGGRLPTGISAPSLPKRLTPRVISPTSNDVRYLESLNSNPFSIT
jgi:hypothetical protein